MKTKIKYINGSKVTIIQEPSTDLNDDIPDEINVDWNNPKPNPYIDKLNKVTYELSPDIAQYFKNSKQLNEYLRHNLKQFRQNYI